MLQYVQDYDEVFPYNTEYTQWHCYIAEGGSGRRPGISISWTKTCQPYIKNVQIANCPSIRVWYGAPYDARQDEGDYMYATGDGNNMLGRAAMADLVEASRTPMGWDGWATSYHNEGFNLVACDGHAKWYRDNSSADRAYRWVGRYGTAGETFMVPKSTNPM